MYKAKLQEYCQFKRWELPLYTTIKEGPPHDPRFQTTVTVNNLSFTNRICKTTKEGQNNAARLALLHFSTSTSSSSASASVSVGSSSQHTVQPNMMLETNPIPQVNATATVAKDANGSTDQEVLFSVGSSSQSTVQPNMMQQTNQIPQVNATTAFAKDTNGSTDREVLYSVGSSSQSTVQPNMMQETNQFLILNATTAVAKDANRSTDQVVPFSVGSSSQSTVQPNMMQETNQIPQVNATATVAKNANGSTDQEVLFSVGSSSRSTVQPNMMQETNQIPRVNATAAVAKDANGSTDQEVLFMSQHYKSQLQSYVQKRNLALPIYSCERMGPPHAMRFKCKVTVTGQTYECSTFFPTLKEAEHGAAKVALMSLPSDGVQEDGSILYKNLLQELAQKKGYALPIYTTNVSGEAHVPTFVSTVEVKGELFTGQRSKTKKQAEMSAAKVAYVTIIEGKPSQGPTFLPPTGGAQAGHIDPIPSEPMEVVFIENEPMEVVEVDKEAIICQHLRELLPQPGTNPTCKRESSSSTVLSAPADVSGQTFTNDRTKIRVLPYTPNMTLPKDGTVVFRDEKYVAVKLGSQSNQ
ncbi:hypothetical protein LWI29_029033 [Acer saccharum]|uniref:DRBM domain-containing protein n=1 Tax=Acer saccharum TaxID=4024 RepID=A0AA39T5X4_ACESA|nr:hypothetical protein LWI29_029033 [Acer saccharum]